MEHEISHSSPGFGKNSGGFGIVIVAAVLVVLGLIAWNFWKDGSTEDSWYRFEKTEAAHGAGHGEASHDEHGGGATQSETPAAAVVDSVAAPASHDSTATETHSADSTAH